MFVVQGVDRWAPRRRAFRQNYCRHCEAPRIAVEVRTLDVFHLFWIPILPLGFWRRWFCSVCGRPPHRPPRTRRGFKWAGVVLLAMALATFWLAPLEEWDPELEWQVLWLGRVATAVALPWLLWNVMRAPRDTSYRKAVRSLEPIRSTSCPFCSRSLVLGGTWTCTSCGLRRVEREDARW